ncbi:aspartic proteinase Asp1-like isoform X1 [Rhododendron vialii]|uniref:aspartic proteinase Asp1-like isoform X1 n=1 Tax=Rhododendron vialii TaxID=182163 RepID=UPI00265F7283|nr:aspartic proteinase Asp1-like isoform X1 [Rhododendron vialii]
MIKKRKPVPPMMKMLVLLLALFPAIQSTHGVANQPQNNKRQRKSTATSRFGSSVVFPVTGNVYPNGYYHVTINIGHPPNPYFLDIDSGSDLTWLQCDAPCTKCTPAPHSPYKPSKDLVSCKDPLCASPNGPVNKPCDNPDEQCDYEVEYADHGSSMGVLLRDSFPLRFTNGSIVSPRLMFGCGYNQEVPNSVHPPYTDGVLGLSDGKSSIMSQLYELGLTRNVVGLCLSGKGGGFLFIGDDLVPSSGVVWMPMLSKSMDKHYKLGPAELLYGKQATGAKGFSVIFDSGSTYSYFNSDAYKATLSIMKKDLSRKKLEDAADQSLPICWKGTKPFKSISDVKNYFKPLVLSFKKGTIHKNVQLQIPPEAYLIITEHGNVCLGILNGTEVGLGNSNVLGDISLQDKMVIYDYEKQQIGWVTANCDRIPNMDRDYNDVSSQPFASDMGIAQEQPPETHRPRKDEL